MVPISFLEAGLPLVSGVDRSYRQYNLDTNQKNKDEEGLTTNLHKLTLIRTEEIIIPGFGLVKISED